MKHEGWNKAAIASIAHNEPSENLTRSIEAQDWQKQSLGADLTVWFLVSPQKTILNAAFYKEGILLESLDKKECKRFLETKIDSPELDDMETFGHIAQGRAKRGKSSTYLFGDVVRQARHLATHADCIARAQRRLGCNSTATLNCH